MWEMTIHQYRAKIPNSFCYLKIIKVTIQQDSYTCYSISFSVSEMTCTIVCVGESETIKGYCVDFWESTTSKGKTTDGSYLDLVIAIRSFTFKSHPCSYMALTKAT